MATVELACPNCERPVPSPSGWTEGHAVRDSEGNVKRMSRETSKCLVCDARLERTVDPEEGWTVTGWPVWLKFASDDDRQRYLEVQRSLPDGELVRDERGVRYLFDADDGEYAIRRANTLRDGFCREAGIERNNVEVWHTPPPAS